MRRYLITDQARAGDVCSSCTITLTSSLYHDYKVFVSKGFHKRNPKLCAKCAIRKKFTTEKEIEDFIKSKQMVAA